MAQEAPRYFIKYHFFKVLPEWRRLPQEERDQSRAEFIRVIKVAEQKTLLKPYTLVGARADVDFMLRQVCVNFDEITDFASAIYQTHLAGYLSQPYSYLATTRRSPYVVRHKHAGQEGATTTPRVAEAKYLIVYPFVKSRPWYKLTQAARQGMMDEHIEVGHKYPDVKIHTSYSFGLDDQEFVVAFETDDLMRFLDLVMELRHTEASQYTVRDTPSFPCRAVSIEEAMRLLGA
jgi:chlorite dismutase